MISLQKNIKRYHCARSRLTFYTCNKRILMIRMIRLTQPPDDKRKFAAGVMHDEMQIYQPSNANCNKGNFFFVVVEIKIDFVLILISFSKLKYVSGKFISFQSFKNFFFFVMKFFVTKFHNEF